MRSETEQSAGQRPSPRPSPIRGEGEKRARARVVATCATERLLLHLETCGRPGGTVGDRPQRDGRPQRAATLATGYSRQMTKCGKFAGWDKNNGNSGSADADD